MILIDNRQNKIQVTDELENTIVKVVEHSLQQENVNIPCEVSIIFVDNQEIKEINKENRNIDKVTDVLSFPMLEFPTGKVFKEAYEGHEFAESDFDDGSLVLGDIALSLEKAKEQSIEFGHSFLREASYLIVHSILHLLGYDHMEEEEKSVMRRREEEILEKFQLVR
ncbi:rRNA maturation RNase YbeY [Clostridium sp. DJ247]|uniref:rRNA maturation RNase YbeY n=1 Tax=Clostridium sp. DJ247 TaxID=2726188 RepID=UPI0016288109|nr:rRNA maturation RNase YbeY [Clostridium sp. DJ247]MBC2579242.1 rRNA maturation RNase YbeY [Clostridium sp. DJ247]MBC2579307.1 rRNA maturation RNase YbeY [Clostridium sp. DJ247]